MEMFSKNEKRTYLALALAGPIFPLIWCHTWIRFFMIVYAMPTLIWILASVHVFPFEMRWKTLCKDF